MNDPGITVCIITRNEEKNIEECLKSVKYAASEIILVDTGSQDKTVEIAGRYGCKIFQSPWQNDFSQARNTAISHASNEFILSIDADERLKTPEKLIDTLRNADKKTGGWVLNVISYARREDGGIDKFNAKLLRLFRNDEKIRFRGIIHEQIAPSIIDLGLNIAPSEIILDHGGYDISPEAMARKQSRNLDLLNKALDEKPGDAYLLYQRAKTQLALKEYDKAEEDISKAIEKAPEGGTILPQALSWGAEIALKRKELDSAKQRAQRSLEIVPGQALPLFLLGEIYTAEGNHPDAYESYKKVESAGEPDGSIRSALADDYQMPPEQIAFRMGRALVAMKLYDNAAKEFERGLQLNPEDSGCYVGLANIAFKLNKFGQSKKFLDRALKLDPKNDTIKKFMSQVDKNLKDEESRISELREKEGNILISLSMIVKNEEKQLPECLESVKNAVDEIIVVDTGSTDRTKEIAKEYGAKVYDFEWKDDFAAARNESIKRCSGEWILYMDADERLTEESTKIIRDTVSNAPPERGGFICTIESEHKQLTGETEIHRGGYPRLFRNLGYPKIEFRGRVHEQITPSIVEQKKNFVFSEIVIEHLGYNQSREVMERKIKRNYNMLIRHVKEEPLNAYAWYQLGQTLGQMKLFNEAEQTIKFAIQIGELSDSVYASAAASLSQMTGNKKQFSEALQWAERSLEKAPDQIYAMNLKAYSLLYLERYEEAEKYFQEVLNMKKKKRGVPTTGFDVEISDDIILKGLNQARQKLGKS